MPELTTETKKAANVGTITTIFTTIAEIGGDLANDPANPVLATYGVEAEVLAATIAGLIGLFRKKISALPVATA